MTAGLEIPDTKPAMLAPVGALDRFCLTILGAAGADEPTADAASRAMMHGSRLGIDSHGVRLLNHYVTALTGGRVNPHPNLRIAKATSAVSVLDADHGHGALAAFRAMDHAVGVARTAGVAIVAIRNTSHFGPAGAYALRAAEKGCIGVAMCNSDSFVRLHDGAARFHGTNPIACSVPVADEKPWLLDMATSAITYNRIQLSRSLGQLLPDHVASDEDGLDTADADQAAMLAPLGGDYGYKGAGLAGLVEIFCAIVTGMKLSQDIAPMSGPDFSSPRSMGAFVLAIAPEALPDGDSLPERMRRYRDTLRNTAARPGSRVLAPGDREWEEAARRDVLGVPIDPATGSDFMRLAARFGVTPPFGGAGLDACTEANIDQQKRGRGRRK